MANGKWQMGKGIAVQASSPSFFYTKLDEMKLQMLGEASQNARARAEQLIGPGSGGRLGALKAASQGVFQITPPNSTDVSDEGQ